MSQLEQHVPGLSARTVRAHVEPGVWSECERCRHAAVGTLVRLATSPLVCRALCHSSVLSRAPALLGTVETTDGLAAAAAGHATQMLLLRALVQVVQTCREAAVPFALSSGVPVLLQLMRSRRAPAALRDVATQLFCAVSEHSEVGVHCLQRGALSVLWTVACTHEEVPLRRSAVAAVKALLTPGHALYAILEGGEAAPLLSLLCAPTLPNDEAKALVTTARSLVANATRAAEPALRSRAPALAMFNAALGGGPDDACEAHPAEEALSPTEEAAAEATPLTSQQLEATMLLALYTDIEPTPATPASAAVGAQARGRSPSAAHTTSARAALLLTALADSGASDHGSTQSPQRILSRACARTVAHLLRERGRNGRCGCELAPLAVHAALATLDAIGADGATMVGAAGGSRIPGRARWPSAAAEQPTAAVVIAPGPLETSVLVQTVLAALDSTPKVSSPSPFGGGFPRTSPSRISVSGGRSSFAG